MASLNCSRSHSPTHPSGFDFDSMFTEISILFAYAEQYAQGLNLKVRNHRKSSFTASDWPFSEPFPEVKVTLRGEILCSPKSDGRVWVRSVNGNWFISSISQKWLTCGSMIAA